MVDFLDLLRRSDRAAAAAVLTSLVPALRPGAENAAASIDAIETGDAAWLSREGLDTLRGLAAAAAPALSEGVARLDAAAIPPVFLYVFDEAWTLAERIRAAVSAALGTTYRIVEDAWAWAIAPGKGLGWPPHRGTATLLDRDAPELVNVWVALTDATPERSCIHFVPLDADPGYPAALARVDAPLSAVRAVPARAGDALFWNANVLHWGGPCSARAAGPRRSCSYTLARPDAAESLAGRTVNPKTLGIDDRFDLVARQIAVYGEGQPHVTAELLAWAHATCALVSARA